jgi:hypothetical protein
MSQLQRSISHLLVVAMAIIFVFQGMANLSAANAQGIQPKLATNPTRLQLFQGDGTNFMLVNPMFYEIKRTGQMITVPAGFVTDFASVPWYARWRISVLGKHSIAAIVHDYLYWEQRCTREEADAILREAMDEYGSSSADQTIVYYAVKYGAQSAWDENAADRKKGYIRVLTGGYENIPLNIDWGTYRQKLFDQNAKEPAIDPGKPAYCTLPPKK